ncbi:winged helix-turn-helix transcriptional regulator [Blastococcus tunisiensis]|uniref:DNA-binding transcriptional regulator, HxlR family n=1 Tax=Blastococcus tunisiensis TaxID=1798228 RepID=A0A1I2IBN6_9ACTN|nr:helix-turn-helix domain-containing protein [Blastococcus sp. DSM 46838]SFF38527.1 DNA-binding transcriptional regulator, HxlR family [Blastococcus sp. DSM 46838]
MTGYAQFCPVAKAAEVFDQRWTLLVLREMVAGSTRFNDLHRGLPRMSRTLLSRRLTQLERKGIVERDETADGPVYELTDAGHELLPVLVAIGEWGVRWMSSLDEADLDPVFLLWDMHRRIDREALPDGQTIVALTFRDAAPELRRWWLLLAPDEVDVCDEDPGLDVDVHIDTTLEAFVRVWRGDLDWHDAVAQERIGLSGSRLLCRRLPHWFRLSYFAQVPRPGRG